MRLRMKKGDASTVRKVWANDLRQCYGIVGTIHDLIGHGIMTYSDYDHDLWCYIPTTGTGAISGPHFGRTRAEALEILKTMEEKLC